MSKIDSNTDTTIRQLGTAKIDTILPYCHYVPERETHAINLVDETIDEDLATLDLSFQTLQFEKGGPRQKLYFDPSNTKCGIVTCGGICPGINDVIRSIVQTAYDHYGIRKVVGFRYGLEGLIPEYNHDVEELNPSKVFNIHEFGGTILGTSRGPQNTEVMVDTLERMGINILFVIGGDGTMKAAKALVGEIDKRNLKIAIVGIPKTIDNDINFVTKSFGFQTAVEKTTEAIHCAHVEATSVNRGIGLVKVMGRESGFIAARAVLAMQEVDFVLVPESPFPLDGEYGLLSAVEKRLETHGHAVILCAEGAGQEHCKDDDYKDASGNRVQSDFPLFLKNHLQKHFVDKKPVLMKYIDPSYIIRSVPAIPNDRVYCGFLGQQSVHAGMAGKTDMVVSQILARYVHVPLDLVIRKRRKINIYSEFWRAVMESTGQRLLNTEKGHINGIMPIPQ